MSANYKMTQDLLNSQQIEVSVSEMHGILSGQICSNSEQFNPGLSCQLAGIEGEESTVIAELINMMGQDIVEHFQQNDFSFQPLLPDDDAAFNDRLYELANWCDGFNAGFAGAFSGSDKDLHEETREVLSDFARISELQMQNAEGLEDDEEDYIEIVEYIRMAAITIYMQNNPLSDGEEKEEDDQQYH